MYLTSSKNKFYYLTKKMKTRWNLKLLNDM